MPDDDERDVALAEAGRKFKRIGVSARKTKRQRLNPAILAAVRSMALGPFAPDWDKDRVADRIEAIQNLCKRHRFNSEVKRPRRHVGTGRGGDRKTSKHGLDQMVLAGLVRLYLDAKGKSGFTEGGPLVRFVNTIGKLILPDPFTNDAVRAAFRRVEKELKEEGRPVVRARSRTYLPMVPLK
jgi:hypothetical protein